MYTSEKGIAKGYGDPFVTDRKHPDSHRLRHPDLSNQELSQAVTRSNALGLTISRYLAQLLEMKRGGDFAKQTKENTRTDTVRTEKRTVRSNHSKH
jgi:hypothetical protein